MEPNTPKQILPNGETLLMHGKHVKVICTLKVGDIVTPENGLDSKLQGKRLKVLEIDLIPKRTCQSGCMIKIEGYPNWIDSDWVDVV